MTLRQIPAEHEHKCDGCGAVSRQRHMGVPAGWMSITGNQVTWSHLTNFHGLNAHACSRGCALDVMQRLCRGESPPFEAVEPPPKGENDAEHIPD